MIIFIPDMMGSSGRKYGWWNMGCLLSTIQIQLTFLCFICEMVSGSMAHIGVWSSIHLDWDGMDDNTNHTTQTLDHLLTMVQLIKYVPFVNQHKYGTSPFSMEKTHEISMAMASIAMLQISGGLLLSRASFESMTDDPH